MLEKADADLRCLRMSAFKLLQPKLNCKLGKLNQADTLGEVEQSVNIQGNKIFILTVFGNSR